MSTSPDDPSPRRRGSWLPWLLALVLLGAAAAAGWSAWQAWQARQARELAADPTELRLDALAARIDAIKDDHRAQAQRLQQADATNRILRDELLGLGQRSAIIEDSFARFADPDRHGAQALRLDEAELLLVMGQRRLQLAGDLEGARRAYALAGGVLEGVDDPAYLSVRQTLQQERAALEALGEDPREAALLRLERFEQSLDRARTGAPAPAPTRPWWQRAFGGIVEVQSSSDSVAVQPADVTAARAALQLELSLARAAAERRDAAGWHTALRRARGWLERLGGDGASVQAGVEELRAIEAMPLSLSVPTLGTTLAQLRQMRAPGKESVE